VIPDDRLRDLLQQAEDDVRPDPRFLDDLYERMNTERRRRSWGVRGYRIARWFPPALLAPAAIVVAIAGIYLLGLPGSQIGGSSPSVPSTFAEVTPGNRTAAPSEPASAGAEPSATQATCVLSFDPLPAKGLLGRILGSGFRPDAALTLVFTPPNGDQVTQRGSSENPTLISRSDGTMPPQDWEGYPGGLNHWTVTDGSCTANIETTVAN
jgi:hypothetical protein